MMQTVVTVRAKRGSALARFWHRNKFAWLFLLPWFIGIAGLGLIPMVASLYLSFTDYNMFETPNWVGFGNYAKLITDDERFLQSVKVTFLYVAIGVPLQLIVALTYAILLNKGIRGLSMFRAIYYVPSLLGGSVAIAILWRQVFGRDGLFNEFLALFGIQGESWVSHPDYALLTLIALKLWQFGSPMVIFLAGLRQIPSEIYEASAIDGATKTQQFFRVTLPLLSSVIFFNVVMQMIAAFQAFTPAYVIGGGGGGALDSILFYTLYLYTKAFQHFEMGLASAMAWLLLLLIGLATAILFWTSKKWVHYES